LFSAAAGFSQSGFDQGFVGLGADAADRDWGAETRRRGDRAPGGTGRRGGWAGEGLGGSVAEDADVFGGAAAAGAEAGAGHGVAGDAEVAADGGDDFGDGAAEDVVVDVRGVDAVDELGLQFGGLVFVFGLELDGVLDVADDDTAGGGDGGGRVRERGGDHLRQVVLEEYSAADSSGDALEGGAAGRGLVAGVGAGLRSRAKSRPRSASSSSRI